MFKKSVISNEIKTYLSVDFDIRYKTMYSSMNTNEKYFGMVIVEKLQY